MQRDFSLVKSMEDAKEALVGSRATGFQRRDASIVLMFETVAGERFEIVFSSEPIRIQMGPQVIELRSNVGLCFSNPKEQP